MIPEEERRALVSHPGLEVLLPDITSWAQKGLAAINSESKAVSSTVAEIYAVRVFDKVTELDNALGALRLALKFVTELGLAPRPDPDSYRYHYENFVLRIVGFLDRAHRLVGAALQLPVKKVESLGGNAYVEEQVKTDHAEVHAALLAVSQVVKIYREPRNELIHSTAFSSRKLGLFKTLKYVDIESKGIDADELARQHFSAGGTEISLAIAGLATTLSALLVALTPYFERFQRSGH